MAFTTDKWWHTDQQGREIGWLWPEDFSTILESFHGERKWVYKFMYEFGFSRAQIDRWAKGKAPIPKHVAMIVSMLGTFKNHKLPLSSIEAPWLPEVYGANARLGPPPQKKEKETIEKAGKKKPKTADAVIE
jgi:hypothetical protein